MSNEKVVLVKDPVLISSDEVSGLKLYRKYLYFIANRELEYVEVCYQEYYQLDSSNVKLNLLNKIYRIVDTPAIYQIVDVYSEEVWNEDHTELLGPSVKIGTEQVLVSEAENLFSGWAILLDGVITPAINTRLSNIL